jgi:TRAP-type C4-dicarboxylate transport system substrate-binding protein
MDTYNNLPEDLQQILMESCKWYEEINHAAIMEGQNAGIEAAKAKNMNFVNLTPDELAQWQAVTEPFDKQWITDNAAKGDPQAIFDDCKALSKKYADVK